MTGWGLICWLGAAGLSGTGDGDRARAAEETVRTVKGTEPFRPASLSVPEGLVVELVAGPPLVSHPTMACFDDRGRLFVCHSAGLNLSAAELEEQLPNSIVMLEDIDGDGHFDRSTTFADKMTFPMGAVWHEGALYVASPPNIWRLRDTDGDGVAEQRDVLVSQFGYTGNAASIHGCFLGPDGRLYWCDGYHGHEFHDVTGRVTSKRVGSYIFSCQADGSDVRIHCGGGMDNPVEVDFMSTGEVLGTVNILYSRPRDDCLVHWLHGGAYPHREQVLAEMKVTGEVLGPAHHFGHVAVSGMLRYRGQLLNSAWRDNLFVTFFNSGKVVRLEMRRRGATFEATQREFLVASGHDFHPTDVVEAADGSLLVVDTGGWFYRGCPTSQYAKPDVLGAIYRVRLRAATGLSDAWGKSIRWQQQTPRQLLRLLVDNRPPVASRALAESARRGAGMLPILETVLVPSKSVAVAGIPENLRERLACQALWVLTRMRSKPGSLSDQAGRLVRNALADTRHNIRLVACRSLATYGHAGALAPLVSLLRDEQPAIRREAATALGRLQDARAVPGLLGALRRELDRTEEHALIYALIEIDAARETAAGLADVSSQVRRGALIALDQMDDGKLSGPQVAGLLDDDDPALRAASLAVFRRHDEWSAAVVETLTSWLGADNRWRTRTEEIRGLLAHYARQPDVARLIGGILADRANSELSTLVLQALADSRSVPLHANWIAPLKTLLVDRNPESLPLTISAVNAIATHEFDPLLLSIGTDADRPVLLRVAALEAAAKRQGRVGEAEFQLLLAMLEQPDALAEVNYSAQLIGAATLTQSQLLALAPALELAGPMQLSQLIKPYERSRDLIVARTFLANVQNARSFTSLPTNEFSDVIKRYPPELLERANQLLDKLRQRDEQKLKRLDRLIAALNRGNAERGKTIFFTEKAKCSTCHQVGDQGGKIGPELTTIGANRSPRDLLESIVFPSSTIVRQYEPCEILTVQGRVLNGLVTRETSDAVYVQQQTGDPLAIPRGDIDEIVPSTVSLMPNGLDEALTESELIDVVTFLSQSRAAGKQQVLTARQR